MYEIMTTTSIVLFPLILCVKFIFLSLHKRPAQLSVTGTCPLTNLYSYVGHLSGGELFAVDTCPAEKCLCSTTLLYINEISSKMLVWFVGFLSVWKEAPPRHTRGGLLFRIQFRQWSIHPCKALMQYGALATSYYILIMATAHGPREAQSIFKSFMQSLV